MSSIQEVFDKDPLSYTKPDITSVIEYFRAKLLEFKMGDKTAGNPKKIPGEKPAKQDAKDIPLDL